MKIFLSTVLALGLSAVAAPAVVILSDNFNAPDNNNFDGSDQTGRRSGTLGPEVQLRSALFQHAIAGNQLQMGAGRIRFHEAANLNNWYNFASGGGAAEILGAGGMRVEFDWTPVNTDTPFWVSFNVGVDGQAAGEPPQRVNHPGTDLGILFRNNGGSQSFDNGVVSEGGNFTATAGTRRVVIDYVFNSFADGSPVSMSASVNGTVVANRNFNWEGNAGVVHMELGTDIAGTRIDNFSLSTIPEPSAAGLFALAGGAVALRRRR